MTLEQAIEIWKKPIRIPCNWRSLSWWEMGESDRASKDCQLPKGYEAVSR